MPLIDVPPGGGKVVAAEWDFLGVGDYPVAAKIGDARAAVAEHERATTVWAQISSR